MPGDEHICPNCKMTHWTKEWLFWCSECGQRICVHCMEKIEASIVDEKKYCLDCWWKIEEAGDVG